MCKIGIIVSVYNTENYLKKCIESIISQSWKNLKLVLIDDGSEDRSGEICDEYKNNDTRIVVIHQENKGVLEAARKALAHLNDCEYITFVDSDDWIDKDTYKKMSKYLEKKYDVISFDIIRYYSENRSIKTSELYRKGEYSKTQIKDEIMSTMIWDIDNQRYGLDPSLCNKLIKRELISKYIKKACVIRADYGQDVAVIYPLMKDVSSQCLVEGFYYYHRQRKNFDIPRYIKDEKFIERLYALYNYLQECYMDSADLRKQIDYFFVQALEMRLECLFRKRTIPTQFLFPFDKVSKDSNIILYGAGEVGKSYYNQLIETKYCNVMSWVDKNAPYIYNGCFVCKPEEGIKNGYDVIVICTCVDLYREEILNQLLMNGVDREKIIM